MIITMLRALIPDENGQKYNARTGAENNFHKPQPKWPETPNLLKRRRRWLQNDLKHRTYWSEEGDDFAHFLAIIILLSSNNNNNNNRLIQKFRYTANASTKSQNWFWHFLPHFVWKIEILIQAKRFWKGASGDTRGTHTFHAFCEVSWNLSGNLLSLFSWNLYEFCK